MGINVLSEFDGISCGQLALQRAGIPVNKYFASEIDKYAIQITQKNFPDTIQLGDVKNWRSWDLPRIDLLLAGSPCQGFSIAGKRLNFEDPRSKLFFEFVGTLEWLREKNPDIVFLLENVNRMHKDVKAEITRIMGVEPIMINSALLSAQNRERLYWTNIQGVTQPEDRGLILADILEDGEGFIKSYGEYKKKNDKSQCLDANYWKGVDNHGQRTVIRVGDLYPSGGQAGRIYSVEGKSPTLNTASTGGNQETKIDVTDFILSDEQVKKFQYIKGAKKEPREKDGFRYIYAEGAVPFPNDVNGKSQCLVAGGQSTSRTTTVVEQYGYYRKLTPVECERLQTLPDGFTEGISNSQRYKCIGNGWTVDVIAHIFSFLPKRFFEK